jgi:hypothetical protein
MKKRTKIVAGAGAVLAIAGGGAAVAADQLSPKAESQAVLADAAKQLGVTPAKLSAALKQALKNRVDDAVASGKLTQAQADALKQRIDAGEFPLFGPGLRGHHGARGFFHHAGGHLDAAAAYLGLTEAELRAALADGSSLADVAKEEGKSVDGLVDAIVADEKAELDEAVQDGRLTDAQRDRIEATMEERVQDFVEGVRPPFRMRGPGHRGMPGMPSMERGGDA